MRTRALFLTTPLPILATVVLALACGEPAATPASAPEAPPEAPQPAPSEPSAPTPSAPTAAEPTARELEPIAVPAPSGPSCSMRDGLGRCTEYPEGHRAIDAAERCATELGAWSEAPCPRDGVAGLCFVDEGLDSGALRVEYAFADSTHASRAHLCQVAGGRYGPLVGTDRVRVAPAPPRLELTPPRDWRPSAPWASATPSITNVAFFRAAPATDGTQPGLSVQRVDLAPGTTLDSYAAELERTIASEPETTVLGSRRVDLDGTAAVVVETRVQDPYRVRIDLGGIPAMRTASVYEAFRVAVVAGDHAWTVVCSGSSATRRAWGRHCERVIESLRVRS